MALVNIESLLERCLRSLRGLEPPEGIEVLSYKRNRGVRIIKRGDGLLEVTVRGYENGHFTLAPSRAAKALRAVFRREFPRSRKVRLSLIRNPGSAPVARTRL